RAAVGFHAVDRRRIELALGQGDPQPGVGEVDAAVGFADDIVRPAEALAFEAVDQDVAGGKLAVGRPAGQPAVAAFADDEPALRVERRAVALAGVLAQQLDRAARADAVELALADI